MVPLKGYRTPVPLFYQKDLILEFRGHGFRYFLFRPGFLVNFEEITERVAAKFQKGQFLLK